MPPAFVLSQDQTLRKYLTKSFSSSSLIHCSVAFSSTGFCSLGCLIFKEQPAASATAHLYYHSSLVSVKNFFQVFLEICLLGVGHSRADENVLYAYFLTSSTPFFIFFCFFFSFSWFRFFLSFILSVPFYLSHFLVLAIIIIFLLHGAFSMDYNDVSYFV